MIIHSPCKAFHRRTFFSNVTSYKEVCIYSSKRVVLTKQANMTGRPWIFTYSTNLLRARFSIVDWVDVRLLLHSDAVWFGGETIVPT